jgi:hypothetical protein
LHRSRSCVALLDEAFIVLLYHSFASWTWGRGEFFVKNDGLGRKQALRGKNVEENDGGIQNFLKKY